MTSQRAAETLYSWAGGKALIEVGVAKWGRLAVAERRIRHRYGGAISLPIHTSWPWKRQRSKPRMAVARTTNVPRKVGPLGSSVVLFSGFHEISESALATHAETHGRREPACGKAWWGLIGLCCKPYIIIFARYSSYATLQSNDSQLAIPGKFLLFYQCSAQFSASHLLLNQFRTDSKPLFADSSFCHYSHAPFGFLDASLGGPFRLGGGSLRANTNWRKGTIFLNVEDVIRQLKFRKSGSLLFTTAGSDVDATVAQAGVSFRLALLFTTVASQTVSSRRSS